MRKIISVILLSFLILSSFIATFNAVSASNLVENSWNKKTPMTQARADLSVVAIDGKIYAIGGYVSGAYVGYGNIPVGINERYDPKTDTWVTLTPMPTPRISLAIAAYDGKIYCMSGGIYPEDQPEIGAHWRSNVVEIYDIATNSWSTAKSPASFTGGGQAHVVDGKIFVIVGNALHMYNPATDVWTRKTDAPLFLFQLASAVVNNKIILAGNIITEMKPPLGTPLQYALKTMTYDPQIDEWNEGKTETAFTSGGVAVATTGVYAPQKVYILGADPILAYEPTTCTWSTVQTESSNRHKLHSFQAVVIDDVVYVVGGLDFDYNVVSVTEQYVPIGYTDTPFPTYSESVPSNPLLNYSHIAIIVVVIGVAVFGLFFCFKKKTSKSSN